MWVHWYAKVPSGADETLEALTQIDIDPNFEVEPGALFTARKVDEASLVDQMGNYEYDEIGNLIKDKIAGVIDIQWTPYGKVRQVTKEDSSKISFRYDGADNRIEKNVTSNDSIFITHYLRDASGNVMAVYNDSSLIEQPIYGSSRLGQYLGHTTKGELGCHEYQILKNRPIVGSWILNL